MSERLNCYRCGNKMAVWGPEGNPNMEVCAPCHLKIATEMLLAEPLAVRAYNRALADAEQKCRESCREQDDLYRSAAKGTGNTQDAAIHFGGRNTAEVCADAIAALRKEKD